MCIERPLANVLRFAKGRFVFGLCQGGANESFKTFVLHFAHLALWLTPKLGCGSELKTKVLRLSFCTSLTLHFG